MLNANMILTLKDFFCPSSPQFCFLWWHWFTWCLTDNYQGTGLCQL